MSIPQLMQLKLYLNKIAKVDNIESYPMAALSELRRAYEGFLETSGGVDPDFPMMTFGDGKYGGKGSEKYSKKNNKVALLGEDEGNNTVPFPGGDDIISLRR